MSLRRYDEGAPLVRTCHRILFLLQLLSRGFFSIVFNVSAWGSRQSDIYAIQGPAKDEVSTYFLWSYSQMIPELL